MEGFGFIIVFAVIAVLVMITGYYQRAKRREDLLAFSQKNNLVFDPAEIGLEGSYPEFNCLRQGDNQYAYNVMRGQWGARPFLGFDYHYATHSTDNKGHRRTHHHYFSAVILASPVPLKTLAIRPEGFFDKVGEFFGFEDIDFESTEFSREFHVTAQDKRWAYDVIHPRMMEFLMAAPRLSIQFGSGEVIAWRGTTFSVQEFESAARTVEGMLERLPEYLVKQQQEEPGVRG